jgi:hypothetical protein
MQASDGCCTVRYWNLLAVAGHEYGLRLDADDLTRVEHPVCRPFPAWARDVPQKIGNAIMPVSETDGALVGLVRRCLAAPYLGWGSTGGYCPDKLDSI